MWMDSWNKRYPNDKLYCNKTDEYGYYVGKNQNSSENQIRVEDKEGYNNKLYFPYKQIVLDGDYSCREYWLASPLGENDFGVCTIFYNAFISGYDYDMSMEALRPLVSLKSGVTVNATDVQ